MKIKEKLYSVEDFSGYMHGKNNEYPFWRIKFKEIDNITDCENVICIFTTKIFTKVENLNVARDKYMLIDYFEDFTVFNQSDIPFNPFEVLIIPTIKRNETSIIDDIKSNNIIG